LDFYWREDNLSGELILRSPSAPLAMSNNGSVLNYHGWLLPGPNLHRVEVVGSETVIPGRAESV